ncbi:MAG: LCP family protein [Anaerolineales bacterium]|nr:LCP family protein [Anaerolineales bacterium]
MKELRSRTFLRNLQMTPILWVLLIAFFITVSITAYLTFIVVREIMSTRIGSANPPQISLVETTPGAEPMVVIDQNTILQPNYGPTPMPWDKAGPVTILLVGLDYRDWEEGGPSRTDTMILMTMNPDTRTAGMLSIPRDLWVNIPGFEYGKINTAYYLGDLYDVEGGGPGLAIRTVEQLLGVEINYYAQIDFVAFERFIDEIGGIEVEVPYEMTVDPIGPDNTVTLLSGLQTLDGPTALAYARNRDTFGGDFDRAARQQQVVMAIRSRILDTNLLPELIARSPVLYQQLSNGIFSNLTLQEVIELAWVAAQIPQENITTAVIGAEQVTMSVSPDGLDILMPDPDAIRQLRDLVFAGEGSVSPSATIIMSSPEEMRQAEAATVSILNATATAGLAAETSEFLSSKGINVVSTGNAQQASANTIIIDYTGNPYTLDYLVELLQITPSNIYSRYDPNSAVDIAILLGDDWANGQ